MRHIWERFGQLPRRKIPTIRNKESVQDVSITILHVITVVISKRVHNLVFRHLKLCMCFYIDPPEP